MNLFYILYPTCTVAWFFISFFFYPWLPESRQNRLAGAFVQAPIWPLGLLAFILLKAKVIN